MYHKRAIEAAIRFTVAFAIIFASAVLAFSQPAQNYHEFYTDQTTVKVTNAGVDALMLRCGDRVGKIEVTNLEQAGVSVYEQFVSLLLMVDDGSYSYKDFRRMNSLPHSFKLKSYWQKCRAAREDILRILDDRTVIFLTHKHRPTWQ